MTWGNNQATYRNEESGKSVLLHNPPNRTVPQGFTVSPTESYITKQMFDRFPRKFYRNRARKPTPSIPRFELILGKGY